MVCFFETVVHYHGSHGLIHIVKMAKALKKTSTSKGRPCEIH